MRRNGTCILLSILLLGWLLPASGTHSAPARISPNPSFGINSNIASRYPVYETLHVPAESVSKLGAGWASEDFQFFRMQPEAGRYDWSWHDTMVKLFRDRGIEIIGVLNGPSPQWAVPGSSARASFFPPNPQLFANFAYETVNRYKGQIKYWQVWNEPDNSKYWQPQQDVVAYTNLLRVTSAAIKRADPGAQVLSGSLVSPQPAAGFLRQIYENGGWGAFDIISLHPYTDPRGPEEGQIDIAGIGTVQGMTKSFGAKPIWATEFGWSTGPADRTAGQGVPISEDTQANYLVRGSVLLRAEGVDRIFWYNLKDTEDIGGAPHNMYGLIRYDSSRTNYDSGLHKPSFLSYQVMAEQLQGTSAASHLDLSPQTKVLDFEQFGSWRRGDQPNGELTQTTEQVHSGRFAAKLTYRFQTAQNDFVVFTAPSPIAIPGSPSKLGMWIYGDGSTNGVKVWLRDSQGEILQFRLGTAATPGWNFMSVPIGGEVAEGDVIDRRGNLRLDFPVSLYALALDDDPDSSTSSGTIYLDDMIASSGSESYAVRFSKNGGEVVDVIWAPQVTEVTVPTRSAQARRVRTWGESTTETASNCQFRLTVGPDPIYLHHIPGTASTPAPLPVSPSPSDPNQRCFDATKQCISGRIRQYWEANGGLPVFGYPTTPQRQEEVEGKLVQVQWFERNRLELHPENQPPYDVLLGRLGADQLTQQGRDWQSFPKSSAQSDCRFFPDTGHNVCGRILETWRSNGLELDGRRGKTESENLALFGLPLSDLQTETIDGKQLQVQWFERARFELHPENSPPYDVLLGLLGNEVLAHK